MFTINKSEIEEGKMRGFEMDKTPVLVAKVGGEVYAIRNKCTHLGCRLSDGTLEGAIVTCPCHGTKFDVTNGKVVQYVSKWPRIMQKAAAWVVRDEEVFDVKPDNAVIRISKRE